MPFERSDIVHAAEKLGIKLPKNLGDVLYSFRYRTQLPESIVNVAPAGYQWIIRPAGRSRYVLVLTKQAVVVPSVILAETKILDATPGVIAKYALSDEQALLAKLRYNRLIDIFTGLACYSLQNHLTMGDAVIALFEFEKSDDEVRVSSEKHYRLVGPEELAPKELKEYQRRGF